MSDLSIRDEKVCIAHAGDISVPCGGTNRVCAFTQALRDAGFEVHLVIPTPERDVSKDLVGIEVHTVPIKERGVKDQLLRALFVSHLAKRIAKRIEAILQIEHSTLAGFATLANCSGFVLDMHDLAFASPLYSNLPFSNAITKLIYHLECRAVNYASRIIVVSNLMSEFIVEEWDVPQQKIRLIPNGYFEERFRSFNFEDTEATNNVSFLGTLHPKIDIVKILELAKIPEISKIYIIGDGPLRGKLEKEVRESNLRKIVITGRLSDEDAFRLLTKSRVLILPEHPSLLTEVSCPVKLLDYAALGKPIVADNVAEICTLFKENNAALISNPSNGEEFINNVRTLLADEELRKMLSSKAKKFAKNFTWKKQAQKLVDIYEHEIHASAINKPRN